MMKLIVILALIIGFVILSRKEKSKKEEKNQWCGIKNVEVEDKKASTKTTKKTNASKATVKKTTAKKTTAKKATKKAK